jgi:hypothetical protein
VRLPAPAHGRPHDPRALDSGQGELEALQREAGEVEARKAELEAEVADRDSGILALQTEKELQARSRVCELTMCAQSNICACVRVHGWVSTLCECCHGQKA